jgi:DeoR/GlpR family transcriptional regulator of sugar metabolism
MRVPQSLLDLRREELRRLIQSNGFLPIPEICKHLQISQPTARRDLIAIEANGQIKRTFGGALADYNCAFASLDERSSRARAAKARMADRATIRIPRSGTVFLDAGTTILAVAKAITYRRDLTHLVVVTNSLAAASVLSGVAGIELHVLGGMFLNRQSALMGARAIEAIATWRFEAAFLSASGMDATGLTNSHESIADLQRSILGKADTVCFCLDASKLGKTAPYRIARWRQVSVLITDANPKRLRACGISLRPSQLLRS